MTDLEPMVRLVATVQPVPVTEDTIQDVLGFIGKVWFQSYKDKGYGHNEVKAVMSANGPNPRRVQLALEQLKEWQQREDWSQLLETHRRCARLVEKEGRHWDIELELFVDSVEWELYGAYLLVGPSVRIVKTVDALFRGLRVLAPFVKAFFEKVLVLDEDESIRKNRLSLLTAISVLPNGILWMEDLR